MPFFEIHVIDLSACIGLIHSSKNDILLQWFGDNNWGHNNWGQSKINFARKVNKCNHFSLFSQRRTY